MNRQSRPGNRAMAGPSAGDYIVGLVAASAIGSAFIAKAFDGARRVVSETGEVSWEFTGNTSGAFAAVVLSLALGFATMAIVRHFKVPAVGAAVYLPASLLVWFSISVLSRSIGDVRELANVVAVLFLGLGVVFSRLTDHAGRFLSWIYALGLAGNVWYVLSSPVGASGCRVDKCGSYGSLLSGFLPQENSLALFLVAFLPSVMFAKTRLAKLVILVTSLLLVLGTGSRTGQVGWLLTFACLVVIWSRVPARSLLSVVPLASLALSTWIFVSSEPNDFTGRGVVFGLVRDTLGTFTGVFFGEGDDLLVNAYQNSLTAGYEFVQEHNQVAHTINVSGLVGLVLLAGILARLVTSAIYLRRELAFVLAAASAFVTEVPWQLDVRSLTFASLLIGLSLVAESRSSGSERQARLEEVVDSSGSS